MSAKPKYILYVYAGLLAAIVVVIIVTLLQISSLDNLYSFHQTYINMSGFCSAGEPTLLMFYGNSCKTCGLELSSFINTTSLFGIWQNQRFYSSYFCAYAINITQYDINQSSVFAPPESASVFQQVSDNRIPLLVFNGEYYKIGGFTSASTANSDILEYTCKVINQSAPQCR